MWMRGMSDMNGDDDKEMIIRGDNDDGGDLNLHLLLGDIYLPYLELEKLWGVLGLLIHFFFVGHMFSFSLL